MTRVHTWRCRFVLLMVALAVGCGTGRTLRAESKWITGYYSAQNGHQPIGAIPWSKFTHICHFAAAPGASGTVALNYLTTTEIQQFIAARPTGKKALVTILDGGAGFANATSAANVAAFVQNISNFVRTHGYDGVDVDWEQSVNVEQYKDFLLRLRTALPDKLITMAAGNWGGLETVAEASQAKLDQINVMCYDMDNEPYTWHNDALFQSGDTSKRTADWRVHAFTSVGVAKSKLGVGIPFYGRRWTGTTAPLQTGGVMREYVPYRRLIADTARWQEANQRWDAKYFANYLSSASLNEFVSYNGKRSIEETVRWLAAQGFGGAMAFTTEYEYVATATGDARYPLSTILYGAMNALSQAPLITTQPASVSAAIGQTATFSVSATGTAPLSYQWQKTGVNILNATSASYTTTPPLTAADNAATFRCVVSNSVGSATSQSATITITSVQQPFGTAAAPLPGIVQAENYDRGGEGVAYHDLDALNNGGVYRSDGVDIEAAGGSDTGYSLGWISAGEWLEYTLSVATSGAYDLEVRVASLGQGGELHVEVDGVNKTSPWAIPDTGGWQNWQSLNRRRLIISAGTHVLRVAFDRNGASGYVGNLNYLRFTGPNTAPVLSSAASAQPAAAAPGQSVLFSVAASDADGDALSYSWSFGDGATASSASATHAYAVAGTYTATASISDGLATVRSNVVVNVSAPAGTGLLGEYFDNIDFTVPKLSRVDPTVNFSWGRAAPHTSMGVDSFSVRWSGQVVPAFSETYTFYTSSDDGVRLYVNGLLLVNNWTDHGLTENSGTIRLIAGNRYAIKIEFYEKSGYATEKLSWSSASQLKQVIPQARLYPVSTAGAESVLPSEALASMPEGAIDLGTVQANTRIRLKLPLPSELAGRGRIQSSAVEGVPPGLRIASGRMAGKAEVAGTYSFSVTFTVRNAEVVSSVFQLKVEP